MVEEAAGTRMYEAKKQAAQKTIEKKDAKLRELNDVCIFATTYIFCVRLLNNIVYFRIESMLLRLEKVGSGVEKKTGFQNIIVRNCLEKRLSLLPEVFLVQ